MERKILLVGIGQTGCSVVEKFSEKFNTLNTDGIFFRSLAIDTDENVLDKLEYSEKVALTDKDDLGTVAEKLGVENIMSFFPCDWENDNSAFIRRLDMSRGANQWRMKALLSFASFLSNEEKVQALNETLSQFTDNCEIYVIASVAGGTGSALFLPVTLYIKDYIKSIGGEIAYSNAVLAMPDIYEGCYSAQQKTKSYANAYASLRELNAVNVTCFGGEGENHPPMNFKIGDEKAPMLLFDSEDEKYKSSDSSPFNRVMMYNRIPGMTSVEAHTSAIAEMLISCCVYEPEEITDKTKSDNPSIYGGVSLTRIVYPIECIVDYIAKRQLATLVSDEICSMHRRVTAATESNVKRIRMSGSKEFNTTLCYCEEYVSAITSMIDDSEETEQLMGRKLSIAHNYSNEAEILDDSFFAGLEEQVYSSFESKITKELKDIIDPPQPVEEVPAEQTVKVDKNGKPIKLKKPKKEKPKKLSASEQKKKFAEDFVRSRSLIISYYCNNVSGMEEENKRISDVFLSQVEGEGYSVIENVIKNNGEYLHPVYALARLCVLYNTLEKNIVAASAYKIPDSDEAKASTQQTTNEKNKIRYVEIIPDCLLELKKPSSSKSAYSKHGKDRFCVCINGEKSEKNEVTKSNPPSFKNMFNDRSLYKNDLNDLYKRFRLMFVGMRYKAIQNSLAEFIEKYRTMLDILCRSETDVLQDVKLASICRAKDNGNTVNVGSSVPEKEKAYTDYIREYHYNKPEIMQDDALSGELFCGLAMQSLDMRINAENLWTTLSGIKNVYKNRILSSTFYNTKMLKNIFEAICETTGKTECPEYISSTRFFMGRGVPLSYIAPKNDEDRKAMREATVAMFPSAIQAYINENVKLKDNMPPKGLMERLLYNAGEYYGEAYFSENINEREVYIRKEVSNIPLYLLGFVNENSTECLGYTSYVKAMRSSKAQMTPMWNADMLYKRGDALIPYISADRQREYEASSARAVAYGLISGKIFVHQNEELNNVYCLIDGREIAPISFNGNEIFEGDICNLMHWEYCRLEQTEEFSSKYKEIISQINADVPITNTQFANYRVIAAAVKRTKEFRALCEVTASMLGMLCDKDAMSVCGYAKNIVFTFDSALRDYCLCGADSFNEISLNVYNELTSGFNEVAYEILPNEKAEQIIAWCKKSGFFPHLTPTQEVK